MIYKRRGQANGDLIRQFQLQNTTILEELQRYDYSRHQNGIDSLTYGTQLTKVSHNKVLKRFYFISEDCECIHYFSQRKPLRKTRIKLRQILKIIQNANTIVLETDKVIYKFQFSDEVLQTSILYGFRYLTLQSHKIAQFTTAMDRFKETSLTPQSLDGFFSLYENSLGQSVHVDQFLCMLEELRHRKELLALFQKYSKNGSMSYNSLIAFWKEEQKEELQVPYLQLVLKGYFKDSHLNNNPFLQKDQAQQLQNVNFSFEDFGRLLLHYNNSIMDSKKMSHKEADLQNPLTDYWISSSHNTYLEAGQFSGLSSTLAYIQALQKGSRCIEIDCWDGPNGEPIVYHGYTLTSKILFIDVVKCLAVNAFKNNPYPLIISLEVHCCFDQQGRMAEILSQEFGDALYTMKDHYHNVDIFPSPMKLKNKILLKGKGNFLAIAGIEKDEMKDSRHQGQKAHRSHLNQWRSAVLEIWKQKLQKQQISDEVHSKLIDLENKQEQLRRQPIQFKYNQFSAFKSAATMEEELEQLKEVVIQRNSALGELLCFFNTPFRDQDQRSIWMISSFVEQKIEKIIQSNPIEVQQFHRYFFTRVYPSGTRIDSSNYNAITPMIYGSQMTSLNYQTLDDELFLYLSKFQLNGNCGYILKPEYMRQSGPHKPLSSFAIVQMKIQIQILSGIHLHTNDQNISPYVDLKLRGSPQDEVMNNRTFRTKVVINNGFNPRFDSEVFHFYIHTPEHALLFFKVYNQAKQQPIRIAWFAVPVELLRSGYRVVPLRNSSFGIIQDSFLFVHLVIN